MKTLIPLIFISVIVSHSYAQISTKILRRPWISVTAADYQKVIPGKRTSALWKAKIDDEGFTSYFRFYPDGTVIGVTSSGTPWEIKNWFQRPYGNSGVFFIDGTNIRFSTTSSQGTIEYKGLINGLRLDVEVFSHINGNRYRDNFFLVVTKKPRTKKRKN